MLQELALKVALETKGGKTIVKPIETLRKPQKQLKMCKLVLW
jgi:hypothetical protein